MCCFAEEVWFSLVSAFWIMKIDFTLPSLSTMARKVSSELSLNAMKCVSLLSLALLSLSYRVQMENFHPLFTKSVYSSSCLEASEGIQWQLFQTFQFLCHSYLSCLSRSSCSDCERRTVYSLTSGLSFCYDGSLSL